MVHPIIKQLKKLTTQYRKIGCLNEGGCCVVASAVAAELVGHLDKVEIVVLNFDDFHTIDQIRMKIDDPYDISQWNDNGLFFCHVIVKFELDGETYYYDGEKGPVSSRKDIGYNYCEELYGITIDEAWNLSHKDDNMYGWNSSFDRRDIPNIDRLAEKYLQNIN